ncbi:MAG: TraX family protein [Faecalibacterium sp.]
MKYIACGSMLLDYIGASCLELGVLDCVQDPLGSFSRLGDPAYPQWVVFLDIALRLIGRLAFPLYCFLLVEGFLHTHSVQRYAKRLLLFGLVSEVPFDWAFFDSPFVLNHQNAYWTLLLGLLAMAGMKHFAKEDGDISTKGILCVVGCMIIATLLQTDYSCFGILLIAALYLWHDKRRTQCVIGALLSLYSMFTASLAFLLVWNYNGAQGKGNSKLLYLFYPVHILILGCITHFIILGS